LALRHSGVQIEAITVVAGNVPVDQGVQNALYTVELCGEAVPVYRGMPGPLTRPLETAQGVHGDDGMGDIGLPISGRAPATGHAVQILIEKIHRFAGEITLVTLGPLTNVAVALRQDPSISQVVTECVIMGGTGQGHGNVTPVTEYNFWADPEAAKIIFESGMPIKMVGWDISRTYAVLGPEDSDALRAVGTPLARFCIDIQRHVQQFALTTTQLEGFDLPDPIAMAVALDPAVATHTERCFVAIETRGSLCRGQSVVDRLGILGREPNAEVVLKASRDRFVQMLFDAVREKE
jgi:purine nucleosidase